MFRAVGAAAAVVLGVLAVLTTSASAAGELTVPCDVELASQQYTLLPDGGVSGKMSVTYSCSPG